MSKLYVIGEILTLICEYLNLADISNTFVTNKASRDMRSTPTGSGIICSAVNKECIAIIETIKSIEKDRSIDKKTRTSKVRKLSKRVETFDRVLFERYLRICGPAWKWKMDFKYIENFKCYLTIKCNDSADFICISRDIYPCVSANHCWLSESQQHHQV